MKKKTYITVLISTLLLSGCSAESKEVAEQYQTFSNATMDSGFDTVIMLTETTTDRSDFDSHFEIVCSSFSYYNQLFDIYNDYEGMNNLKTVNDHAGIEPVKVDEPLIELLITARDFYKISSGEFDITIGSILKVWHEYRTDGLELNKDGKLAPIPDIGILKEQAEFTGWDKVIIDEAENTVYISDPETSIDVGGIAKGFATEKVALELEAAGCDHAALNAGGNNRTIGYKIDNSAWRVGIQNPDDDGSILVVNVPGSMSFVTSGDYERFYVGEDGQIYSHIIDPQTLFPAKYYRSVSIITDDSAAADCLSTTLYTLTYENGLQVIEAYRNEHPDNMLEVIWIAEESSLKDSGLFTDKDLEFARGKNSKIKNDLRITYTDGLAECITW